MKDITVCFRWTDCGDTESALPGRSLGARSKPLSFATTQEHWKPNSSNSTAVVTNSHTDAAGWNMRTRKNTKTGSFTYLLLADIIFDMEAHTKEEILSLLTDRKEYLRQTFSVEKIGLFGSYAKNLQRTDSDIDIYVEFGHKTFDNLTGLWDYLETLYNRKVDLLYKHTQSKGALFEKIRSEVIFG